MKNELIETLKSVGLSEKEATVYLTSLSLGPSTVLRIARASEVKRTTIYSILESLKQRGLMRMDVRGWKTLYSAENPEKLESLINTMKSEVKNAMPKFAALHSLHTSGAFIKYYESLEAIKGVYESLLRDIKPGEDYLIVGDLSLWLEQDPVFFQNFTERRAKLDINIRVLMQDSEKARENKKFERNYNEHIKIMPPDFKLTTNMVITPRRLMINQLTLPLMAMVIENESIIQMHRELFEMVWKSVPDETAEIK